MAKPQLYYMRIGLLRGEVNRLPQNFGDLHFYKFPSGTGNFAYGPNNQSTGAAFDKNRIGQFAVLPNAILRCTFPAGLTWRGKKYSNIWIDLHRFIGQGPTLRLGYILTRNKGQVVVLDPILWRIEEDKVYSSARARMNAHGDGGPARRPQPQPKPKPKAGPILV